MESVLARIQALEDRAQIADLIARYGPVVDAVAGEELTDMWTRDGEYRVGSDYRLTGRDIASLTSIPEHQALVHAGCGHVLSAPTITVDGDTAVAINHSMVVKYVEPQWIVERLSANRWHLVRTADGWRVKLRENELLQGQPSARNLLRPVPKEE